MHIIQRIQARSFRRIRISICERDVLASVSSVLLWGLYNIKPGKSGMRLIALSVLVPTFFQRCRL